MTSLVYAEDIFRSFYSLVVSNSIHVQPQDFSPIQSFYVKIAEKENLTKNQANYILKLLEKYKNLSAMAGLDYKDVLDSLGWKQPFRVLDLSKKIYVEKGQSGNIEICVKFPFQLKKEFETEIESAASSSKTSQWDPEEKVRRLNFYNYNLVALYEFANKHNFEIDDSFMNALADVEEIWQNADDVVPFCQMTSAGLELVNASEDAENFYNENKVGNLAHNLILAKSMGFLLKSKPEDTIGKIAASPENSFWIKDYNKFFSIHNQLKARVCVILDRTSDTLQWLQNFIAEADKMLVNREEIKVCFREGKDSKNGINDWIKAAGVGGKVEEGKIFIFESKPAKWLFKDNQDVTILVTNNIYPPTNIMTRDWFNSHPFVVYLGDTKPTEQKGQKIVEL